ncbi:unnamed protein product [Allacma fusca]|uniref:D-serine dehydratase-like domain-containing protein n=1 Tax=Allacma fusca TaxID=39272 RepID=A0A8J2NW36_9HEXA|nr:unnamed protein product [Allacma fusca]
MERFSFKSIVRKHDIFEYSKGFGKFPDPLATEIPKWDLLKEEVSLPAAVLNVERLEHNLNWMQNFVDHYGFKLAPHGKTTMCPELFHKQITKGSWGMTVATPIQAQTAHSFGISKILMANQLVGKYNMEIIATIQGQDPSFEFYCLVDSAANVKSLGEFFSGRNQTLKLIIEYGVIGGRTGIRDAEQETEVLNEIKKHESLELVGVEFFEGILTDEEQVQDLILHVLHRFIHLAVSRVFTGKEVILTGAGSAWFDVVSERFAAIKKLSCLPYQVELILRSGCYVTHAARVYEQIENRLLHQNPIDGGSLQPALTIWAYVQSCPEANSVIIGFGKRDSLHDSGYPVPTLHFRPGEHQEPRSIADKDWEITKMMDQHSFMQVEDKAEIQVGDIIVFDICHPCTTFDKFKYILAVGNDFVVQDVFQTYF